MKIALHQTGPIAGRCAEVLLAERDIDLVGLLDRAPDRPGFSKVDDLASWDVLVSDAIDPTTVLRQATEAHVPLVTVAPLPETVDVPAFPQADITAMARALASERSASFVAATSRGTKLRRGTLVVFPPPVGSLMAERQSDGLLLAPTPDDWGGLLVETDSGTVGVSDNSAFLQAIALASAAITIVRTAAPLGIIDIASIADIYLDVAESAGLEIATFRRAARR